MPTAGSLHLSRGPAPGHWSTSATGPKAGAGGLSANRGSGHPGGDRLCRGGEAHLGLSERGSGKSEKGEEVLKKHNPKVHLNEKAKPRRRRLVQFPFPPLAGPSSTARSPLAPRCEETFAPTSLRSAPSAPHQPSCGPPRSNTVYTPPYPTPPRLFSLLLPSSCSSDCRFLASLPQL